MPNDPRPDLASLVAERTLVDGANPTALPGLTLVRMRTTMPRTPVVYGTSICVVAQGAKLAHLGDSTCVYDAGHYLICSLTLPIESEVRVASPNAPFYGVVLDIDPAVIGQLLLEMDAEPGLAREAPPLVSSPLTEALERVIGRLVCVVDDPTDRRILGPSLVREAVYEVLRGPHGRVLRAGAARSGRFTRVPQVIRYLEENFRRPLEIEEIAHHAAMSASALHRHFKQATTMSPMQYVKKLRLHHARTLILTGMAAGQAAFEVGYASPSQFSREFKRMFGHAPQELRSGVGA